MLPHPGQPLDETTPTSRSSAPNSQVQSEACELLRADKSHFVRLFQLINLQLFGSLHLDEKQLSTIHQKHQNVNTGVIAKTSVIPEAYVLYYL